MCIVLCCCWVISTVQSSVLLSRIKNFHQTAAEQLTPIRGIEREIERWPWMEGGREMKKRDRNGWMEKERAREKGELGSLREGEGRRIKGGRTRERVLREG